MIEANIINSRGKDMVCLIEYQSLSDRGRKTIIYKHGFCGNKTTPHRMLVHLSHMLIERGYTILRFDCVGAGDSEGDWSYMTIPGELEDFKRVLHWAQLELKPQKTMILGYSMGGLETALCCREIPLEGILFWSPCSSSSECFLHLLGKERFRKGLSGQNVDFMGDRIGKEFFEHLGSEDLDPIRAIKGYENPVYLIHGMTDVDVPPENSQKYLDVLPQAQLHLINNCGHGYDSWDAQDELWRYSSNYIEMIMGEVTK